MRKYNNVLKKIMVCLFTVLCLVANTKIVANATEVDGNAMPIIEVQDYSIDGGMIEAGKQITVNLKLHNTSSVASAGSVMMTLSNSTGTLYPAYGNSNQIFVGSIGADDTKEVSVPMVIGNNFMGNAVDLTCQFDYVAMSNRLNNSATIVIPTSGGSTIGVKSIDVSAHAIVNGKSLLAFSYVNQSSSNITDAKLIVDGNVSSTSKEIKLDTVYAGKSYTNDYYVIFEEAGNQTINVSLQYTDADGSQVITDLGSFDVSVSKENALENDTEGLMRIIDIIGKAVALLFGLVAVGAVLLYVKKKVA
ncbi:hypothetical protein CIY_25630 [Butyrivibrio fibrisolvens 16/4]|nr:hypothetical protein CIY_25630 [Butyrivibrio fibrisolvens 16/4]